MTYTLIVKVPASEDFTALPDDAAAAIEAVNGVWPPEIMPHSRVSGGYKLILAQVADNFQPAALAELGRDWTLLFMGSPVVIRYDEAGNEISRGPGKRPNGWDVTIPAQESAVIDFMPDVVEYDDAGNETSRTRPTAVSVLPHGFGGEPPIEVGSG